MAKTKDIKFLQKKYGVKSVTSLKSAIESSHYANSTKLKEIRILKKTAVNKPRLSSTLSSLLFNLNKTERVLTKKRKITKRVKKNIAVQKQASKKSNFKIFKEREEKTTILVDSAQKADFTKVMSSLDGKDVYIILTLRNKEGLTDVKTVRVRKNMTDNQIYKAITNFINYLNFSDAYGFGEIDDYDIEGVYA